MRANRRKEKSKLVRVGECLYRQSLSGMYYFKGQIAGTEHTQSLGTTDRAMPNRELRARREKLARLDYAAGKMTLAALCERYKKTYQHQKVETVKQKKRILTRIEQDSPTGRFTPIGKFARVTAISGATTTNETQMNVAVTARCPPDCPRGQSGLLTRIAAMESISWCGPKKSWPRFWMKLSFGIKALLNCSVFRKGGSRSAARRIPIREPS
jgi:hypothetical protein